MRFTRPGASARITAGIVRRARGDALYAQAMSDDRAELERAERLPPNELAALRERWWSQRRYVYVTPGDELARRALRGFPAEVRAIGERCRIIRFGARAGGGYYPDRDEVELAGGVAA